MEEEFDYAEARQLKRLRANVRRLFKEAEKNPNKEAVKLLGFSFGTTESQLNKAFEQLEDITNTVYLIKNGIPGGAEKQTGEAEKQTGETHIEFTNRMQMQMSNTSATVIE